MFFELDFSKSRNSEFGRSKYIVQRSSVLKIIGSSRRRLVSSTGRGATNMWVGSVYIAMQQYSVD